MKFLERLLSKHNLWTLAKVSGLWPPLAWTLHWSMCLMFGVWGLMFVWCLWFGVWGSERAVSCVLYACSQGMFRVIWVFQDPAAASAPSAAAGAGCYWCERNCAGGMKFAKETLKQKLSPQMWSCQGLALILQFYNIFFHYPVFFPIYRTTVILMLMMCV